MDRVMKLNKRWILSWSFCKFRLLTLESSREASMTVSSGNVCVTLLFSDSKEVTFTLSAQLRFPLEHQTWMEKVVLAFVISHKWEPDLKKGWRSNEKNWLRILYELIDEIKPEFNMIWMILKISFDDISGTHEKLVWRYQHRMSLLRCYSVMVDSLIKCAMKMS